MVKKEKKALTRNPKEILLTFDLVKFGQKGD